MHEFANAIVEHSPVVSGTSTDALETMRLVYRIYWADPEWRDAFGIQHPEQAPSLSTEPFLRANG